MLWADLPKGAMLEALDAKPTGVAQQLCFSIATKERTYFMCAQSESDFASWTDAIHDALKLSKRRAKLARMSKSGATLVMPGQALSSPP